MTRAQSFVSNLLLFTTGWLGLSIFVRPWAPFPLDAAIVLLPLECLLAFGLYAAGNVLFHLMVFRECPDAHKQLSLQVKEAKAFLTKHGFSFKN